MNQKEIIKFLKGFDRMCANYYGDSSICPPECPLNGVVGEEECSDFIIDKPEIAVPIVLKWMQENPVRTRFFDFMEKHPKAPLNNNGYPKACAKKCGYVPEHKVCRAICAACWETDVEEED